MIKLQLTHAEKKTEFNSKQKKKYCCMDWIGQLGLAG
jgi:hypothetical protein